LSLFKASWGLLGVSGSFLGASMFWGLLGPFWGLLEASWGAPGASRRSLGSLPGPGEGLVKASQGSSGSKCHVPRALVTIDFCFVIIVGFSGLPGASRKLLAGLLGESSRGLAIWPVVGLGPRVLGYKDTMPKKAATSPRFTSILRARAFGSCLRSLVAFRQGQPADTSSRD